MVKEERSRKLFTGEFAKFLVERGKGGKVKGYIHPSPASLLRFWAERGKGGKVKGKTNSCSSRAGVIFSSIHFSFLFFSVRKASPGVFFGGFFSSLFCAKHIQVRLQLDIFLFFIIFQINCIFNLMVLQFKLTQLTHVQQKNR